MSGKLLLKTDFLKNYETNKMIYVNDIKCTLNHYSIKFDRKTKKKELNNFFIIFLINHHTLNTKK